MYASHPLLLLALLTFLIVLAILLWSLLSTRRRQKYGPDVSGPGGRNDPMAGS